MPMNIHLPAHLKEETKFKTEKIMEQSKIDRINELARKQKAEGLTEEEKTEQAALRREYIEGYKRSLMSQLDNMYIVEPDGSKKKVTPKQ